MAAKIIDSPCAGFLPGKSVARTWCEAPESVQDLLPPGLAAIDEVLSRRRAYFDSPDYRERLRLHFQVINESYGAPPSALESAARVGNRDAFLVLTGQQAGLLTGPLYTVFKVATAVHLARRLSSERNETFLPCFWCASEDADYAEVQSIAIPGREGSLLTHSLPDYPAKDAPVDSIPISHASLDELESFLRNSLPETEFTPGVLEAVRKTYRASGDLAGWMIRFLWELFPDAGLLITAPVDGFYQRASRAVFQREWEEPLRTSAEIRQTGLELKERGVRPQIHKEEELCSFFMVQRIQGRRILPFHGSVRLPTRFDGTSFRTSGETYSRDDLLKILDEQPHSFSANAVLRPVCQDAAFPTAVSVLGPGEIGYYAQIGPVYRRHGVPRPCFAPRLSATLLPSRFAHFLEKNHLEFTDLQEDLEALVRRVIRDREGGGFEAVLEPVRKALEQALGSLRVKAQKEDPSLIPATEKDFRNLEKRLGQIENRFVRAASAKEGRLRCRIAALQGRTFPEGKLSERVHNIVFYLNAHGPSLASDLIAASGGAGTEHRIVFLE